MELISDKPGISPNAFLEVLEVFPDISSALNEFSGDLEEKQEKIEFWQSKLAWFREEVDIQTSSKIRNGKVRMSLNVLYDFLEYYRESGMRVDSAKRAGTSWPTIKRRITKGDKLFLKDFNFAYEYVEDELNAGYRDIIVKKARMGDKAHKGSFQAAKYMVDATTRNVEVKLDKKKDVRPLNVLIQNITKGAELTGKVVQV